MITRDCLEYSFGLQSYAFVELTNVFSLSSECRKIQSKWANRINEEVSRTLDTTRLLGLHQRDEFFPNLLLCMLTISISHPRRYPTPVMKLSACHHQEDRYNIGICTYSLTLHPDRNLP